MSYLREMVSVSQRDAQLMLEVVEAGWTDTGTEPFPTSVLWALCRLIPSDACVGYQEADVSGQFSVVDQVEIVGEPPTPAIEAAFHSLGWQNPMHCRLHAREQRVLRLSDLLTRRQRRSLEYDDVVWKAHGIDDCLRVWLPAEPGRARSIYLERSEKNYTNREVALLALLRPHLIQFRAEAESRRRCESDFALTRREAEVLGYIADGHTNGDIAGLLFISPNTVRKHVENIFGKLGVRTRTAAAAYVQAPGGGDRVGTQRSGVTAGYSAPVSSPGSLFTIGGSM